MNNNPILAIINAQCFYKKTQKQLNEITQSLKNRKAEIILTRYKGHATKVAYENKDTFKNIIIVGGDGSVQEVINGMNLNEQRLGIFPVGYANNFATELGFNSWRDSLNFIYQNQPSKIDLIKITFTDSEGKKNEKKIASFCSIGFFNYPHIKFQPAVNIYDKVEIKKDIELIKKPFKVKGRIDNGEWNEVKLSDIVVGNTRYIQRKSIFKNANLQDNFFHCVFGNITSLKRFIHSVNFISNTYLNSGTFKDIKNLDLIFEKPQIIVLDGEIFKDCIEISFEINPEKLICYKK